MVALGESMFGRGVFRGFRVARRNNHPPASVGCPQIRAQSSEGRSAPLPASTDPNCHERKASLLPRRRGKWDTADFDDAEPGIFDVPQAGGQVNMLNNTEEYYVVRNGH